MGDDLVTEPNAAEAGDDRYVVISADGHAGGDVPDYRPYLEAALARGLRRLGRHLRGALPGPPGRPRQTNWDSDLRLTDLEAQGLAAEVIFPNTIPPFFPNHRSWPIGPLSPPPTPSVGGPASRPTTAGSSTSAPTCRAAGRPDPDHDARHRGAGGRDPLGPGRRVTSAASCCRNIPPDWACPQFSDRVLRPAVVGLRGPRPAGDLPRWVPAAPPMGPEPDGGRDLPARVHVVRAPGALPPGRRRRLRAPPRTCAPSFTEQGTAWVPDELRKLDYFWDRMGNAVGSPGVRVGQPRRVQDGASSPSEYWGSAQRPCRASFIRPAEVGPALIPSVSTGSCGGATTPTRKPATPFSTEALRLAFAGVPLLRGAGPWSGATPPSSTASTSRPYDLLADRIGPRVAEIADPLVLGLVPRQADKCPAFIGYDFAAD